ncbi:MAG: glycosyltransferase, partial [Pseudomonadota bacterium]|nr:glycosyltransferase [Pseudomonadota bacterium]
LLLVLVPRHPERFALAATLARECGFTVQRYSESGGNCEAGTQVLVGDTMGDMHFYYALGNVAFVGGSLVDTGCQNLIEPAALGLPVLSGPSLYNFQAVSDLLREQRGMIVVPDEAALAREVVALISQPEEARVMGERARQVVAGNQGATERLSALILDRIK